MFIYHYVHANSLTYCLQSRLMIMIMIIKKKTLQFAIFFFLLAFSLSLAFTMKSLKTIFKSHSIYECAKPFYFISRIFGFSCFNFDLKKKKTYFDFFSILTLIGSISVWSLVMTDAIDGKNFIKASNNKTFTNQHFIATIYSVFQVLNPIQMILTLIYHNLQKIRVSRFLKKIYVFDENLKKIKWSFHPSNSRAYILVIVAFAFAYVTLNLYFFIEYSWRDEIIIRVGICLSTINTVIIHSQFLLTAFCVLSRMKILYKNFESLQLSESRELFIVRSNLNEKIVFQNVTKLYKTLTDAIDEINLVFTITVWI